MTTTTTAPALRLSRAIKADPETVFRAWTEPEHLNQWSAPEGMDVTAEVDLRVGGSYRLRMKNADGEEYIAVGVYREIDPPRRLSYTWTWEHGEHEVGETLITVEFKDLGGSTEVHLTHELLPHEESRAAHEQGWESCLNRLEGLFA